LLDLFIHLQKMVNNDITELILIATLIFLLAPFFIILYVLVYNRRKKRHKEEKAQMKTAFDAEIVKTQLEVQEQTMQNIGADLHDNIGQLLSLSSLTLGSIQLNDLEKARQKIDAAIDLTGRSIKEMRLLGKLLQGDQLMGVGLPEAIRHEITWMERSGKYQVNYTQEGEMPINSNLDKDLIIFRILQEVMNNIIKHSFATQINIKLVYRQLQMQLYIDDNGVGFKTDSLPADKMGMGLLNMNKRAKIVGGEVTINSAEQKGTRTSVIIPYP
jgi:two-component system NarL family sensor kinase